MWARDRHHRILALLSARGQISNDLLIQELQVSRETIRRDILELEAGGQLRRVHGGIVAMEIAPEPAFQVRMNSNAAEKRRIGIAAAGLIKPGMTCAIDTGSTTLAFATALATVPDVAVITNSLDVATMIWRARPRAEVILLGGRLDADVPGTYGEQATAAMQHFLPDIAVLSPVAVDAEMGATSYDLAEADLGRMMIKRAAKVMLLADHLKVGAISRVRLCGCEEVDTLVTDTGADPAQLEAMRAAGIGDIVVA